MRGSVAVVVGLILGVAVLAASAPPPPVMKDLGRIEPTPEPTGEPFRKRRLITTFTMQNTADGETQIMFEATDVADEGEGKFKTLAAEGYTLTPETPAMKGQRDRVLKELRALESVLLDYVEEAGPPRERAPLMPSRERPYE